MLTVSSITKLMGDSFRHHAQALIGYEDDVEISDVSTPSMISRVLTTTKTACTKIDKLMTP